MPAVRFVDFERRLLGLSDGEVLPITNCIDEYGDDCEPQDAVVVVAGTDEYGWVSVEIDWDDLEPVALH